MFQLPDEESLCLLKYRIQVCLYYVNIVLLLVGIACETYVRVMLQEQEAEELKNEEASVEAGYQILNDEIDESKLAEYV